MQIQIRKTLKMFHLRKMHLTTALSKEELIAISIVVAIFACALCLMAYCMIRLSRRSQPGQGNRNNPHSNTRDYASLNDMLLDLSAGETGRVVIVPNPDYHFPGDDQDLESGEPSSVQRRDGAFDLFTVESVFPDILKDYDSQGRPSAASLEQQHHIQQEQLQHLEPQDQEPCQHPSDEHTQAQRELREPLL